MLIRALLLCALAGLFASKGHAQASDAQSGEAPPRVSERWLLHLDGGLVLPLTKPQSEWFGPGLNGMIGVSRSLNRYLLVGARLRGGFLFDGPRPTDGSLADPGFGTFSSLGLALRVRPLASMDEATDPRRGTGFWGELVGAAMLTGGDVRASLEVGIGWNFEWGIADVGPSLRYLHVIQPNENIDGTDAKMLSIGLEVTFLDARRVVENAGPPPRSDRDYDGIYDEDDSCPDEPEDFDGFEDEDGCPDTDNDQDGILDDDDACPTDPEDIDGFEDEDGCPDPDNDQDRILDVDDACPNEPETINGNEDQDGCPDEGLIVMVDDRIVLEERVLFDFERARVKSRARPVLEAIVTLIDQHPEWERMRVEGHADIRGSAEYNRRLSERRARNVMRALVRLGVDGERIDSQGFGADRPRAEGETEEAHQRNRRVEFVVMQRREVDMSTGERRMDFESDAGADDDAE